MLKAKGYICGCLSAYKYAYLFMHICLCIYISKIYEDLCLYNCWGYFIYRLVYV